MRKSAVIRRGVPALAVGLGLAASGWAQTPLYTFNGTQQYDRLGAAVGAAGDTNGDTRRDVIVGAPEDFQVFFSGEGFVRIYSGANGSVLRTIHGDAQYDQFGFSVDGVGGDVTGDGRADVVVGAPSSSPTSSLQGMVRVINGDTGATVWTALGSGSWTLGHAVSGAGDVNGDGVPDVIAGAPEASVNGNSSGAARVFSGTNGTVLWTFPGSASNKRRGYSVSELDDVNSDGRADVIVGSLFDGVRVYSGMTGSTLGIFTGPMADVYGKSVCSIADVTGDGKRDIVIGATQEDVFNPGPGYVQVRNGVTGALLFTASGIAVGDRFGSNVSDAGDFNADGTTDILVGADPSNGQAASYVRILSGVNGSILATMLGAVDDEDFGFSIAGLGDVNNNGRPDFAVGAPLADPSGLASGYARVYEGATGGGGCGGTQTYCQTSPNSAGPGAMMSSIGTTNISANDFVLLATGCPPSQNGIFYYGPNQIQAPFGNGFRCVGGGVFRLPLISTSAQGIATFGVNYNNLPLGGDILPNSIWNFQFWYRDPGVGANFNLSNGLNVEFCP